jgi:hypothetical protein
MRGRGASSWCGAAEKRQADHDRWRLCPRDRHVAKVRKVVDTAKRAMCGREDIELAKPRRSCERVDLRRSGPRFGATARY